MSSQQSKYGAVEVAEAPAAATPKRRGVVIALCLVGGALFAVAGPGPSQPVWKSTSVSGARSFFTKSFLGDDAAVLAKSSGEESTPPRQRRGGRRTAPRRRPGPSAAADDEARNHQRGVPRHTNSVGATVGTPRPRPTIVRHAAPPCSNFHQYSRNPTPARSEFTQNRIKNHPAP